MRFHVVGLPHTQTTNAYSACAYTEKTRKFCIMMHQILGHEVYLYAGEKNEAPCTEHIQCISEEERAAFVGDQFYTNASFDWRLPTWAKFNATVAAEIGKRKQPKDFICILAGLANESIEKAHPDLMTVEYGIGYTGSYTKFRVFESYAWMHATYAQQAGNHDTDGHFFHDVIPSYFEADRFPVSKEHGNYLLYIGRMTHRKGLQIVEEVAKATGLPLHTAGTGDLSPPAGAIHHGVVEWRERGELMKNALCCLVPTLYLEPFGSVAVEAQMCGTPVLTTDWGAFPETVEHGVTGYRCRTLKEFIDGALTSRWLNRSFIAKRSRNLYSLEPVALRYQKYFDRLSTLRGAGWYEGVTWARTRATGA